MPTNAPAGKDKLADVDPRILIFDGNPRKDTRIDVDWVEKIQSRGVIHRILVEATDSGDYLVVDGQRRTLGAIAAGLETVPILIRPKSDQVDLASDQLVSNLQRKDLTDAELLGGYKTLSLLGVSAEDIAKRTGEKKTRVDAALKVAASEKTEALAATAQIDIEHLAAMVEFEDDSKATATLRDLAERSPSQFPYKVAELRKSRSLKESKKKHTEKLKAAGVPIVKASDYEYSRQGDKGRRLEKLQTPAGKPLTMTAHKKCPGHAAAIYSGYYSSATEIWYVCTDWEANGHQLVEKTAAARQETDEQKAEREEHERARAEEAHKMEVSRELRREWIVGFLQRHYLRKLPDVDQVIARAYVGPEAYALSRQWGPIEYSPLTARFLGLPIDDKSTQHTIAESVARLTVSKSHRPFTIALAAAIAHLEFHANRGRGAALSIEYFTHLIGWGYTPTEWELKLVDGWKNQLAEQEAADLERAAAEEARLAQEQADADAFNNGEMREDVDGAEQALTADKVDA